MGREYIPLVPRRVPTYPPTHPPRGVCGDVGVWELLQQRRDQLSEAVPGPVEPALHGAEVAGGDLGDLLITLALELAQYEHHPVMLGQLAHALIHRVLQEPLAVEIVGPRGRVLELQRPVVGLPVLLDRLEQHQRVAAAVAQLVLGQVRRDRVNPRREFLGLVEPVQVPEHPDEHFLHQVLGPLPVPDRAVDEVEQARLVAVDQGAERLRVASEVALRHLAVVEIVERRPLQRPRARLAREFEDCPHARSLSRMAAWDPLGPRLPFLISQARHEAYRRAGRSNRRSRGHLENAAPGPACSPVLPRGHQYATAAAGIPPYRGWPRWSWRRGSPHPGSQPAPPSGAAAPARCTRPPPGRGA